MLSISAQALIMFHPALFKLIGLLWRGSARQFRNSLKTARGLVMTGFIVSMIVYGIGSLYFVTHVAGKTPKIGGIFNDVQNDFLTLGLFVFTSGILLFSTGEATIFFTASEAAFLFPAPISRKQLVAYKLFNSLLGIMTVSLFFACFSTPSFSMLVPRLVGTLMTISFLQLLTMNVAFTRQLLEEKTSVLLRRSLGAVLAVAVLLALFQTSTTVQDLDVLKLSKAFQSSFAGRWMLAPFQLFTLMLRAPDWTTFLPYGSLILLLDLVLLTLVFRLDALSLESAMATSEKLTARLKMVQSKGVWQALARANPSVAKRKIQQLPYWGGIGPVVWQKLTTTFRSSNKLFWLLTAAIAGAATLVYFMSRAKSPPHVPPIVGSIGMAYMSLLICLSIQNEIERVGFLKSLPLSAMAVVLGELLGFVVLLSVIQSLFIAILAGCFPAAATWLWCGALLTFPLNFLLFGVDKLVFYIYPTRMAKGTPGDFQAAGKQMVFMMMKMLILGGAALIVGLASLPGALLFQSPVVAAATAAIVLVIECLVLVPFLIAAYDRFDPGMAITA